MRRKIDMQKKQKQQKNGKKLHPIRDRARRIKKKKKCEFTS